MEDISLELFGLFKPKTKKQKRIAQVKEDLYKARSSVLALLDRDYEKFRRSNKSQISSSMFRSLREMFSRLEKYARMMKSVRDIDQFQTATYNLRKLCGGTLDAPISSPLWGEVRNAPEKEILGVGPRKVYMSEISTTREHVKDSISNIIKVLKRIPE